MYIGIVNIQRNFRMLVDIIPSKAYYMVCKYADGLKCQKFNALVKKYWMIALKS